MMAVTWLLAVFFFAISAADSPDVGDFDETSHGYEFIFHDNTNLMLIIHDNKCYFSSEPDNLETYLSDDNEHHSGLSFLGTARDRTEYFFLLMIRRNDPDNVKPTTLEAMRDKYEDLLADFRCAENNGVFEIVHSIPSSHSGSGDHDNK